MANLIQIKRSTSTAVPTSLAVGELAYSSASDKLFIGEAGNVVTEIGGFLYVDLLNHNAGTLTANSAIIVDGDSKIDNLKVDFLEFDGRTISSTDTNGDITIQPDGTGAVNLYNPYIDQNGSLVSLTEYIQDVAGGGIVDSSEIDATYDDGAGTTSLSLITGSIANSKLANSSITVAGDSGSSATSLGGTVTISGGTGLTTSESSGTLTVTLDDTAVTPGSYGSSTAIPTFTVDQQGRLTAAGTVSVATQLSIDGDSGTDTVDLLNDTLTFTGGANVTTSITNNTVTVDLDTDLNSLTSVDVDNITIDGNTISTTNTDGDLEISPNGQGTITVPSGYEGRTGFSSQSLVNKSYVDSVANGLDVKASCRVATTADLSATYDNGAGTLTATANGAISVDGVSLSVGDRVLVKDQTTATENGIYKVTTTGGSSAAFVLTRTPDADEASEVTGGAFTFVEEGTANADNGYVATHNGTPTLGTDNITFDQFSGAGQISAGDGLTKTGNTIDVVGTADRITANADSIDIASTYVGQTSITTLGTIATGTWNGTSISDAYIDNDLTISGGVIDSTPIGGTTASSGAFTNLTAGTSFSVTATTDSTSTGTGSIVTAGGVGIAKSVYVGLNLTGAGSSTSTLDGFTIDGGQF